MEFVHVKLRMSPCISVCGLVGNSPPRFERCGSPDPSAPVDAGNDFNRAHDSSSECDGRVRAVAACPSGPRPKLQRTIGHRGEAVDAIRNEPWDESIRLSRFATLDAAPRELERAANEGDDFGFEEL